MTLQNRTALPLLICLALTLSACGGRSPKVQPMASNFPYPEPPAMVTDEAQRINYAILHFWDKYFEAPARYNASLTEQAFVLATKEITVWWQRLVTPCGG